MQIKNQADNGVTQQTSVKEIDVDATSKLNLSGWIDMSRVSNNDADPYVTFKNGDKEIFSLKLENGRSGITGRYNVFAKGADGEYVQLLNESGKGSGGTNNYRFNATVDIENKSVTVSITDINGKDSDTYTCEAFTYNDGDIDDLKLEATVAGISAKTAMTLSLDDLKVEGIDKTKSSIWVFDSELSDMNGMSLYVDYTEDNKNKEATKSLEELGFTTTVTGAGAAKLAITFTDVPETTAINSVTIK